LLESRDAYRAGTSASFWYEVGTFEKVVGTLQACPTTTHLPNIVRSMQPGRAN
jgi:hypothetical protein